MSRASQYSILAILFLIRLCFHHSSRKALKENNHNFMRCHTGDREILQMILSDGKQNVFLSKLRVFSCSASSQRWAVPINVECEVQKLQELTGNSRGGGSCPKFLDEFTECIQFGFVLQPSEKSLRIRGKNNSRVWQEGTHWEIIIK